MTGTARAAAAPLLLLLLFATLAHAQTVAVELTQSTGVSSEDITFAGTQARVLAEPWRGWRLTAEASWGERSRQVSDVFGTAYPYGGRLDAIEAFAEWFRRGDGLRAVRAGRYRTPFGLSSASDHAYVGYLRPPLIRYPRYYALSNGYLEHGVDVLAGAGPVSLELSVGRPGDVGTAVRRDGTTSAARAEVSAGPLILGASVIDTTPYLSAAFARGRTRFHGLDLRVMHRGIQLRGEWLDGRPYDGTSTHGGYLDLIVHTRWMDRVTAVARAETLDYDTPSRFALETHRLSGGARIRLWRGLSAAIGVTHQFGRQTQRKRTAVDSAFTWVWRTDRLLPR